jgi:hypothetical protein
MRLRTLVLVLLVLAAGGYAMVPPLAQPLPAMPADLLSPVRGAIHIHTRRSDGTGTIDQIAAAAAGAGLKFIVVTDHGDATRPPTAPSYRSGVLCIDAVEISTDGGHIVALGLTKVPYPLAGEPRDVLEDIRRLGGFAVVAHPTSVRPELRWTDWSLPTDGLEWLNMDSEWRDEGAFSLARLLLTYPIRPPEALATILDRPEAALRQWDALTSREKVVGLVAADAHARLGLLSSEQYVQTQALPLPTYESIFRTASIVVSGVQFSGDAVTDAAAVVGAIRAGHVYSTIDAVGGPAAASLTAVSGVNRAAAGDTLAVDGPVNLRFVAQAPPEARILLIKDGSRLVETAGGILERVVAPAPGVYRVEVELPGAPGQPPVPWIVSNPIYVGRQPSTGAPTPAPARPREVADRYSSGELGATVERSPGSDGATDVVPTERGGSQASLRYALSGSASASPYVAFAMPTLLPLSNYDRIVLSARAEPPMRMSVQLRTPVGQAGERWARSVFVSEMAREITLFFSDFSPRGPTRDARPRLTDVNSILFVIDSVNTAVGSAGRIWIDDIRYAR